MECSAIYDYPCRLDSDTFEAATGKNLAKELAGDNEMKIVAFLNTIHSHIYDFVIYNTGRADIKNRIIKCYAAQLEAPIKRAIIAQGKYLLENDNIGMWNGAINTVDGGADVKDTQDVITKIICPEAVNILMGTQPNILYAGG